MMSVRGILKKSQKPSHKPGLDGEGFTQSSDKAKFRNAQTFTNPNRDSLADLRSGEGNVIFNIENWNTHNCDLFQEREAILSLKGHNLIFQEINQKMKGRETGLGYKWFLKNRFDKCIGIGIPRNMVDKRREDIESLNSIIQYIKHQIKQNSENCLS